MSIYIKGMEMPTEEEISKCIIVRHDGEVWTVDFDNLVEGKFVACFPTNPMRAIPVPPHGRLIDADALKAKAIERSEKCGDLVNVLDKVITAYDIETAPTVIPAKKDGK